MASYRADGTKMGGNDLCRLGDYVTCGHGRCGAVVYRLIPYPGASDGSMTSEDTPQKGYDRHYRDRCQAHAEPHDRPEYDPPHQAEPAGPVQLALF